MSALSQDKSGDLDLLVTGRMLHVGDQRHFQASLLIIDWAWVLHQLFVRSLNVAPQHHDPRAESLGPLQCLYRVPKYLLRVYASNKLRSRRKDPCMMSARVRYKTSSPNCWQEDRGRCADSFLLLRLLPSSPVVNVFSNGKLLMLAVVRT